MPGPRRDMAMHHGRWAAGWEHVLPRQGMPLTRLISTAGRYGFTGTPDGPRWSMPEVLPLPEKLLPLDAELAGRIGSVRRSMRADPLVTHLTDDLGGPREVLTSLDRLAAATGHDADEVRLALTELVESGDALVGRGQE